MVKKTIENYFRKKNRAPNYSLTVNERKKTEYVNSNLCVCTYKNNNLEVSCTTNSNLIPLEDIFDDIDASEVEEKVEEQKYEHEVYQKTCNKTESINESGIKKSKCTFSTPTKIKKRSLPTLLWAPKKSKTFSKMNSVSFLMNEANIQQTTKNKTKPKVAPSSCETSESQQLFSQTNHSNDELLYESTNLKLPLKFKRLHEVFVFLDAIIGLNFNNKNTDCYLRWSEITKLMLKHKKCVFTYKMFGQIKSLLPDVIDVKQQRKQTPLRTVETEYALKPVYTCLDECNLLMFTSQQASYRSKLFRKKLLKIVYNCHSEFLKKIGLYDMVCGKKLTNWHPGFKLHEIGEIQPCELPSFNENQKVLSSARFKILEKFTTLKKNKFQPNEPPSELQSDLLQSSKIQLMKGQKYDSHIIQSEKLSNERKNKLMLNMTRTSENHNKLKKLNMLPNFTISLKNVFRQEKKTTLKLEFVINKLMSHASLNMSAMLIQELVDMLEQNSNNWLKLFKVNQETFVKIEKDHDCVGHLKKYILEFELKH